MHSKTVAADASSNGCTMTLSKNQPLPGLDPSWPIRIFDSFFSVTASNMNSSTYRSVNKHLFCNSYQPLLVGNTSLTLTSKYKCLNYRYYSNYTDSREMTPHSITTSSQSHTNIPDFISTGIR